MSSQKDTLVGAVEVVAHTTVFRFTKGQDLAKEYTKMAISCHLRVFKGYFMGASSMFEGCLKG